MNNAAIIIIGNEILSGRTLDQNSNFIAKRCSKIGIAVEEVRVIPAGHRVHAAVSERDKMGYVKSCNFKVRTTYSTM